MGRVLGLQCRECGQMYPAAALHVCEQCFGPLEVSYDYAVVKAQISRQSIAQGPLSIWRYKPLLPIETDDVVDTATGLTPLIRAENLGRALGLRNVWVKNDTVNPTFSFKDRPVSIASTKARELGFDTLACASTGNLAGAVAAHAAKAGMRAVIFIPADLEPSKIVGASIYEPTLVAVDGNYDDVNRLCSELVDHYEWAFANINVRPYYAEGSKTLAYEVAEQLGWRIPNRVVVPIASGSMFTKIWKGYNELVNVGLVEGGCPKMIGAQALGCSPVVTAYDAQTFNVIPVKPSTIAKSLAIGNPADGYYALKVIGESGGCALSVDDVEIVDGIKLLARTEGIFAETAGGVSIGVLKKLADQGAIDPDELVVVYVTGNGLKTQEAVADKVLKPLYIKPTLSAFEDALAKREGVVAGVA
ncbi:MAG TPA: threonine synthase [Chloroflexota bacterium]|jgi:threonine synthase|nr:threonine synthase [Chloroflexota bacterium]